MFSNSLAHSLLSTSSTRILCPSLPSTQCKLYDVLVQAIVIITSSGSSLHASSQWQLNHPVISDSPLHVLSSVSFTRTLRPSLLFQPVQAEIRCYSSNHGTSNDFMLIISCIITTTAACFNVLRFFCPRIIEHKLYSECSCLFFQLIQTTEWHRIIVWTTKAITCFWLPSFHSSVMRATSSTTL